MRDYLKLILLFISCFTSIIFGAVKHDEINLPLNLNTNLASLTIQDKSFVKKINFNHNTVLASNTYTLEIASCRGKNQTDNSFSKNFSDRINKKLKFYVKNTDKISLYKSHNISSCLKNEICTRAP